MSKIQRRVNYKLYPSKNQEETLLEIKVLHQQLYNMALEQRIIAYKRTRKSPNYNQQAKDLTELRAACPEYKALNAQSSQKTLKRLHDAFNRFFDRLKDPTQKAGFPRFKSRERYSGWSYPSHGDGWTLRLNPPDEHKNKSKHGYLRISGVGFIKIRGQGRLLGIPKTLDIIHKQGQWYASIVFNCETPETDKQAKSAAGLDWGVETFATLAHDDGQYSALDNPRHLKRQLKHLKRMQKDLSRRKRGSRNWRKLKKKIATLHRKITQKRHDFLHQTSAKMVKENALIAVEKLNVKGMTAHGGAYKKGLNREILSTAPGTFHHMLKYKAEEAGTQYVEVPTRKVKPSQTCSGCGHQMKKALHQRKHQCPECDLQLSRDQNAARVILNWALTGIPTGGESAWCGERSLLYETRNSRYNNSLAGCSSYNPLNIILLQQCQKAFS